MTDTQGRKRFVGKLVAMQAVILLYGTVVYQVAIPALFKEFQSLAV